LAGNNFCASRASISAPPSIYGDYTSKWPVPQALVKVQSPQFDSILQQKLVALQVHSCEEDSIPTAQEIVSQERVILFPLTVAVTFKELSQANFNRSFLCVSQHPLTLVCDIFVFHLVSIPFAYYSTHTIPSLYAFPPLGSLVHVASNILLLVIPSAALVPCCFDQPRTI
jgi:hypothetical protein